MYRAVSTLDELREYLSSATFVAFDFETAPDEKYRKDECAALDAHKSHIVGISFSVAEGDAVYLPLSHRSGQNATDPDTIWSWLAGFFADPAVTKIAHNLAFESQFLYARGITRLFYLCAAKTQEKPYKPTFHIPYKDSIEVMLTLC